MVCPLTVLAVTRAKEKGTFLPENVAWCFSTELLLHQEMQILFKCSRQRTPSILADRGSLLQIKAIMEKAAALGKYFVAVFYLKAASKMQE